MSGPDVTTQALFLLLVLIHEPLQIGRHVGQFMRRDLGIAGAFRGAAGGLGHLRDILG